MMMAKMGMLPMIGRMVGSLTAAQSMLPSLMGHMIFGVVMGLTFDPVLRRLASSRSTAARVKKEAEAAA